MKHAIIGYGYSGQFLSQCLATAGDQVIAISRTSPTSALPLGVEHISQDIEKPFAQQIGDFDCLYYLAPPRGDSNNDKRLEAFLAHISDSLMPKKVIYCGSSGVYGNHNGDWVTEKSACLGQDARHLRRLNAEQRWQNFCARRAIPLIRLRVSGIYGPERLPFEAVRSHRAIIAANEAPISNAIFVKDLAYIMQQLALHCHEDNCINVSDGTPRPMGALHRLVAQHLKIPVQEAPFSGVWEKASPMLKSFLKNSRKLSTTHLRALLPAYQPRQMEDVIHAILQQMES